jgi:hypothetical protein
MSCAGQRPVVRPWRWAWAGEERGAGPYRALVAAPGAWGCWWSLGVSAPSSCVGCSPAAFAVGVAASRAPSAAACGRASSPLPVRMPLHTHRSLRAAFQKVYAAVRRTSPASVAASGAQLPSTMALSCTHRSAPPAKLRGVARWMRSAGTPPPAPAAGAPPAGPWQEPKRV